MIESILHRVEKLKKTGDDRWIACCPAHNDTSPSLAIRCLGDDRILLHCFAGCSTSEVLAALGLTFEDLFPKGALRQTLERVRRPFNAIDILRCIAYEAQIAAVAASNLSLGVPLHSSDRERLTLAAARLHRAVEVAENA